ncbi:MAG: 3-keto-5-aminohexanoate cleavage protein [Bosea sp.]|uniref:3-keto-5-aminohexanoate cleavage protein n=1 Tax=Bosea sp. (in: a-proteobacteria) TaxID=1871050 RepID=UPI0010F4C0EB|nr:3-keto-5-aminohexanoate cleavage protein [Bosea sp. (in: a-proteobacteria)]MCP4734854.1 3-keto-5-aminohexanoate cleavage protein [Bosea sp. (in: a-proteobacteria)]
MSEKVIVTCAVTGSSLSPSMSRHLPVTPEQIVEQSLAAVDAGAAILHLHARDPKDGRPTNDPAVWRQFIPAIRERSDAIINMSASLGSTAEGRLEAVLDLEPDIATVIVGSMNYGLFRKAENQGVSEFALDWEKEAFGPKAYEIVTQNSFATIARMIDMLIERDIAMEFECYDVGHLYILERHLSTRNVKRPIILQFLTGILGGIPSDIDHLVHLKRTAERLFGPELVLFTHGTGLGNIKAATFGALMGTHLRVGQEDNLFERPGVPFKSNAAQVEKIVRVMREFALEPATAAQARDIVGLPR